MWCFCIKYAMTHVADRDLPMALENMKRWHTDFLRLVAAGSERGKQARKKSQHKQVSTGTEHEGNATQDARTEEMGK